MKMKTRMDFWMKYASRGVGRGLVMAMLIALASDNAMAVVDIDPQVAVGPVVQRWGWDLKGSQGLTNTSSKAQTHYGDVNANLVRIPFFVDAHYSDGTVNTSRYSTMITSIQKIKAVNPDVEVFASLKLQGGDSFVGPSTDPDWVTAGTTAWPFDSGGSIFGNQSDRPNPEFYSQLVADYVSYLDDQGIGIDYLGINNETDGALGVNRYIGTIDLLKPELTSRGINVDDIQFIAPDTFSPSTAVSITNSIDGLNRLDSFDIVGSHSYAGHFGHTRGKWVSMSNNASGSDLWFTEAHINPSSSGNGSPDTENIKRMRDGLGMVFAANKAGGGAVDAQGDLIGASSFVWWGGGGSSSAIDDAIKREVINSTIDGQPVYTTPDFAEQTNDSEATLYQAYVQENKLTLWIGNPGSEEVDFPVDLLTGRILNNGTTSPSGVFWQGCEEPPGTCSGSYGNTISSTSYGSLSFDVLNDKSGLTVDSIPYNSIAMLSFDLAASGDLNNDSFLNNVDLAQFIKGWRNDSDLGDMDFDGDTDRDDWFYLRAAFIDAGQGSQLAGFSVPEPSALSLCGLAVVAMLLVGRRRVGER